MKSKFLLSVLLAIAFVFGVGFIQHAACGDLSVSLTKGGISADADVDSQSNDKTPAASAAYGKIQINNASTYHACEVKVDIRTRWTGDLAPMNSITISNVKAGTHNVKVIECTGAGYWKFKRITVTEGQTLILTILD